MQLGSEVLLQLRSYAEAFLEGSYNILMGSIRKDLDAGLNISRLSADDFLRFFRLASLFTGFVRRQQACCGRFWLLETKIKMQGASVSVFTFLLRHVAGRAAQGAQEAPPTCTQRWGRGLTILLHICNHGLGDIPLGAVAVAQRH